MATGHPSSVRHRYGLQERTIVSRTWKDRGYRVNQRAARKHGWRLDPDVRARVDAVEAGRETLIHRVYERWVSMGCSTRAEAEAKAAEYQAKHGSWRVTSTWPRVERERSLSVDVKPWSEVLDGVDVWTYWQVTATIEFESELNEVDPYGMDDPANADVDGYAGSVRRKNSRLADSVLANDRPRHDHHCSWCHENRVHRDRKRGYLDPVELEGIPSSSIPGSLKNDEWKRPVRGD